MAGLRRHADEVILRVRNSHGDDPTVFDYNLQAVAEGRFYRTIEGYPSRYKLDEDGLILALGFAVIDRLYSASHSDRDLDEAVEEIIEPIAALDRTANVVLAALTVTCLDSGDPKIAATLIRVFADLQNLDVNEFDPFARLARICPVLFTEAAHSLCLSGDHQNNFDWIQEALILAREDENAWEIIFKEVQTWLSYYSLAPERGLFPASFSSSSEEEKEQYKEKERKIREGLESLSETEKQDSRWANQSRWQPEHALASCVHSSCRQTDCAGCTSPRTMELRQCAQYRPHAPRSRVQAPCSIQPCRLVRCPCRTVERSRCLEARRYLGHR